MQELKLEAEPRIGTGKSVTRKLRMAGKLPAVLYGLDKKPQILDVDNRQFLKLMQAGEGENVLIDLHVGKHKAEKVLLKDIQHHPVTEKILHVDFLRVDLTKKINVKIPVHLTGSPEGVKAGGVLEFMLRELEVICLPMDIPPFVEIDVTRLGIHDAVHVSEITLDKVEILTDKGRTIVSVQPPTVIKEPTPVAEGEAAAAEAEPTEPEVITEKKKKDEDEEEGKEGKEKGKK